MSVADARDHHQALISRLMNGPGDSEGAMHRAERLYGLGFWSQWNLRHKKRATADFIERVRQAYLSMLETSVRRDIEKLKAEWASGNASTGTLIAEAEALLQKIEARR